MTAEKEQEMITVLAPLIAILSALATTHPDRRALATAYDEVAQALHESKIATWSDSALQRLAQKLNEMRAIVTGVNNPANTLM